jgi:hypothetical protein
MKTIKILTMLVLLLGFGTVYSQETSAEPQKSDQVINTSQADRDALNPNPASGEQTPLTVISSPESTQSSDQAGMNNTEQGKNDMFESPNPQTTPGLSNDSEVAGQAKGIPVNQGNNPSDPNCKRPETK